jgi:hypothetical protein
LISEIEHSFTGLRGRVSDAITAFGRVVLFLPIVVHFVLVEREMNNEMDKYRATVRPERVEALA